MTEPAPGSTVGIDTSALIPAFDSDQAGHRESSELLDAVRIGRLRAVVSTVAAAETLVVPIRMRAQDWILAIQAFLLTMPNVVLSPVDWRVALRGAQLRATHGIRLPDALIIASAMDCDAFVSADERALSVAGSEGLRAISLEAG